MAEMDIVSYIGTRTPADFDTLFDELEAARGSSASLSDAIAEKADNATTLSGYGITDAYTKTETDTALSGKQNALSQSQLAAANSGITAAKLTADETALGEVINGGAAGTKNLFDMSGAQTFDVTGYGVHCTINKSTGVITLDGTNQDKKCTGNFNIKVSDSTSLGLIAGTVYKLTCDGYTTSDTTIGIYVYTSGATPEAQFDTYNHTELAWNSSWEQSNGFRLFVRSGTVVNNITLRPMLCRKTLYDANPEFEPYAPAKTNVEITTALVELVDSGAKNVLQFDAVSRASNNGVDFTYNADGSVTVNTASSASDNAFCYLNLGGSNVDVKALCDGNHVIAGCPTNSGGVTLRIIGTGYTTVTDSGDGATITAYSGENVIRVAVYVAKNGTPSNIKVKPMICTKAAWDVSHAFEPYALSNPVITPAAIKSVDEGAKNLLKNALAGTSSTKYAVTATFDANGVGTISGTNNSTTNDSSFSIVESLSLPVGHYHASGCPSGGAIGTYRIDFVSSTGSVYRDIGNGVDFDIAENETIRSQFVVYRGKTSPTGTVQPMICTAQDWTVSQKFVPYCPSMAEMYEMIQALQSGTRSAPALAMAEPEEIKEPETGEEEMR